MEQLTSTLLHVFYWFTVQSFGLSIFRLKINRFKTHIILSSIILSQVSLLLQTFKLIYLLSILQPLCFLLCVYLIYRLNIWHSLLFVSISFGANVLLESALNLVLASFDYEKFITIIRNDYLLQGYFLCFVNIILSLILQKYRIGFTFINSKNSNTKYSKLSIKFYIFLFLGALLLYITSFTLIFYDKLVLLVLSVSFLIFLYLIHMSYEKEMKE